MVLWGLVAVTDSVQHTSKIAPNVRHLLVFLPLCNSLPLSD